jgi:hypothetical protein
MDAAADVQAAGISPQRRPRLLFVAGAKHDDVTARKPVAPVQLRKPRGGAVGNKIRLQASRFGTKRAADDLFDLAFMQVNAGTKHGGSLELPGQSSKRQVSSQDFVFGLLTEDSFVITQP